MLSHWGGSIRKQLAISASVEPAVMSCIASFARHRHLGTIVVWVLRVREGTHRNCWWCRLGWWWTEGTRVTVLLTCVARALAEAAAPLLSLAGILWTSEGCLLVLRTPVSFSFSSIHAFSRSFSFSCCDSLFPVWVSSFSCHLAESFWEALRFLPSEAHLGPSTPHLFCESFTNVKLGQ